MDLKNVKIPKNIELNHGGGEAVTKKHSNFLFDCSAQLQIHDNSVTNCIKKKSRSVSPYSIITFIFDALRLPLLSWPSGMPAVEVFMALERVISEAQCWPISPTTDLRSLPMFQAMLRISLSEVCFQWVLHIQRKKPPTALSLRLLTPCILFPPQFWEISACSLCFQFSLREKQISGLTPLLDKFHSGNITRYPQKLF